MTRKSLIDRRTCLRGLGAALGLPLLESMGWAESLKGGGTPVAIEPLPQEVA